MNYILDTNVISELVAAKPNTKVIDWIQSIDSEQVFLSVITVGELKKGIEKLPDSKRKERLNRWLQEDLLVRFEGHLLNIDTGTMLVWGKLIARLEARGRPMPAIDALLAAIALEKQYTLVTRNSADFAETGVLLFNPWE
ncbi:MAG: type II toxin-antitoxin system VapC family toxin [Anaerolineales bacterium]